MFGAEVYGKLLPTHQDIRPILDDIRDKYQILEITSDDDGLESCCGITWRSTGRPSMMTSCREYPPPATLPGALSRSVGARYGELIDRHGASETARGMRSRGPKGQVLSIGEAASWKTLRGDGTRRSLLACLWVPCFNACGHVRSCERDKRQMTSGPMRRIVMVLRCSCQITLR